MDNGAPLSDIRTKGRHLPLTTFALGTGMTYDFQDLTDLIRSLQRREGKKDCFNRDIDDCEDVDCAWRVMCLEREVNRGRAQDS